MPVNGLQDSNGADKALSSQMELTGEVTLASTKQLTSISNQAINGTLCVFHLQQAMVIANVHTTFPFSAPLYPNPPTTKVWCKLPVV